MMNPPAESHFSHILIALMQGVLYQENDGQHWSSLLLLQARVRDYCQQLGLELILDEAEGYAYLRQRSTPEGEVALPRLIPRRQLSYPVSLILVLLRKKLAEFDTQAGDTRLIVSREQIAEQLRLFLPDTANEARLFDRMDTHLNKVVELGFLYRLRGQEQQFEVRRILKAFVDAQWLSDFDQRLKDYGSHGAALAGDDA